MLNNKINRLLMNSRKLTWMTMLLLSLNASGKNNNSQDTTAQHASAGLYTREEMLKYAEMLKNPNNWVKLEAVSPDDKENRLNYKEFQARKQKEFAEYKARQQEEYEETVIRMRKQFEASEAQRRQYMLMQCEQYKRFIEEQEKQAQK